MKALTKNCFLALLCLTRSQYLPKKLPFAQIGTGSNGPAPFLSISAFLIRPYILLVFCMVCISQCASPSWAQQNPAIIYGEYASKEPSSALNLKLWHDVLRITADESPDLDMRVVLEKASLTQGVYSRHDKTFKINLPAKYLPAWISLTDSMGNYLMYRTLISPGDSLKIKVDRLFNQTFFSGPSAAAFQLQHKLQDLWLAQKFSDPFYLDLILSNPSQQEQYTSKIDIHNRAFAKEVVPLTDHKVVLDMLKQRWENVPHDQLEDLLRTFKGKLPQEQYQTIRAEYLSRFYFPIIYSFERINYPRLLKADHSLLLPEFDGFLENAFSESFTELDADQAGFSPSYLLLSEYLLRAKSAISGIPVLKWADAIKNTPVRESILTAYFSHRNIILKHGTEDLETFYKTMETAALKLRIKKIYQASLTGDPVPEYDFISQEGKPVQLSQFKGKTVLLDFWMTGCSACIAFNKYHFGKLKERFSEEENLVILAVSIDSKRDTWQKSIRSGRYTPDGIIQLYTGGKGTAHPYLDHYAIGAFPYLQLIDKDGKLATLGFNKPTYQDITAKIEQLLSKP